MSQTTHTLQINGNRATATVHVCISLHRIVSFERAFLEEAVTKFVWDYVRENVCSAEELASVTDMEMLQIATVSAEIRFQVVFSFTRKRKQRHNAEWNF